MSPDAQRIAIAEACGFKQHKEQIEHTDGYQWIDVRVFWVDSKGQRVAVPDYLNDLNAMHEAEATLKKGKEHEYADWLKRCAPRSGRTDFHIYHATAAQRAEAFLRTIGKWEDGK